MTTQDDSRDGQQDSADLNQLNEQLTASIGRCRSILDDCRSKLANKEGEEEQLPPMPANDPGGPVAG